MKCEYCREILIADCDCTATTTIADLRRQLAEAEKDNARLSSLWGCDLAELLDNATAADERDAAIAENARLREALSHPSASPSPSSTPRT